MMRIACIAGRVVAPLARRAAPVARVVAARPAAVSMWRPAVAAHFSTVQTFLDRAEVTERVLTVLKNFEKVDPAKVSATCHFGDDLGLDSLDVVEVGMALEDEFCITIPDEEADKLASAEDAIHFISTHPQAK